MIRSVALGLNSGRGKNAAMLSIQKRSNVRMARFRSLKRTVLKAVC